MSVSSSSASYTNIDTVCDKCEKDFDSAEDLIVHHTKVHTRGVDGEYEECDECDEEFYDTTLYRRHLSRSHGIRNVSKVEVECHWCEDDHLINEGQVGRYERTFCSRDCLHEWQSEWMSGENHHNWKGGWSSVIFPNGMREKVLERDYYTCRLCRKTDEESKEEHGRGLHVHHRTPRRCFDNEDESHSLHNLISLCPSCHKHIESKIDLL